MHGGYTADVTWHADSTWSAVVRQTGDKLYAGSYHELDAYFRELVEVLAGRRAA